MGFYVNPKNMTKDKFFSEFGQELTHKEYTETTFKDAQDMGAHVVVLIDNGAFKAGLICYNESEHTEFINHPDSRPKKYYLVGVEHLQEFMNK